MVLGSHLPCWQVVCVTEREVDMIITGTKVRLVKSVKASDYGKKVFLKRDSEATVILSNLPNKQFVLLVGEGRYSHRALVNRTQFKVVR